MKRVLVVGAFGPEIAPLEAREHVVTGSIGIGPVEATLGASRLVARFEPELVLFTGTCGAYPGAALAIGDVVVASAVHLVDPAVCEGRAHLPAPMRRTIATDASISAILEHAGARGASVASTTAITDDEHLGDAIARSTGCIVEHLESFAIALVASEAKIPFGIVLGVANAVGPGAQRAWQENHVAVAKRSAAVVTRALAALVRLELADDRAGGSERHAAHVGARGRAPGGERGRRLLVRGVELHRGEHVTKAEAEAEDAAGEEALSLDRRRARRSARRVGEDDVAVDPLVPPAGARPHRHEPRVAPPSGEDRDVEAAARHAAGIETGEIGRRATRVREESRSAGADREGPLLVLKRVARIDAEGVRRVRDAAFGVVGNADARGDERGDARRERGDRERASSIEIVPAANGRSALNGRLSGRGDRGRRVPREQLPAHAERAAHLALGKDVRGMQERDGPAAPRPEDEREPDGDTSRRRCRAHAKALVRANLRKRDG